MFNLEKGLATILSLSAKQTWAEMCKSSFELLKKKSCLVRRTPFSRTCAVTYYIFRGAVRVHSLSSISRLFLCFPLLTNILTTLSGEQRQPVINFNFFHIRWIDPRYWNDRRGINRCLSPVFHSAPNK